MGRRGPEQRQPRKGQVAREKLVNATSEVSGVKPVNPALNQAWRP